MKLNYNWGFLAHAKIALQNGNKTLTLPTLDYYYYKQPYYRYEGMLYFWKIENKANQLVFADLDVKDSYFPTMKKKVANYSCAAILINYNILAHLDTGCTFAQLALAVEELSEQFIKAKLPPIKLIVVVIPYDQPGNIWSTLIPEYASTQPSKIPDGPPSIDMAFLEGPPSIKPGAVNSLLLSPGYIAYQWIYFLLKKLRRNLRIVIYVVASLNAIVFLVFIHTPDITRKGILLGSSVTVIAVFNIYLALFYCSIRAREAFSLVSVVLFRLSLLLLTILQIVMIQYNIRSRTLSRAEALNIMHSTGYKFAFLASPIANSVLLFAFTAWFASCTYKVKRYSGPYSRFLQLTIITGLAMLTSIISSTQNIVNQLRTSFHSSGEIVAYNITLHTATLVRIVACLCVMGIKWPKVGKRSTQHSPLGELTTVGYDLTLSQEDISIPLSAEMSQLPRKSTRTNQASISKKASIEALPLAYTSFSNYRS
ncbi:hypothetical protein BDF19DRAFT_449826 [Syncephalis fuscata]|nr:hypothetical protein BDF19DRAFT_449826 [Syncephalis fuscata]